MIYAVKCLCSAEGRHQVIGSFVGSDVYPSAPFCPSLALAILRRTVEHLTSVGFLKCHCPYCGSPHSAFIYECEPTPYATMEQANESVSKSMALAEKAGSN